MLLVVTLLLLKLCEKLRLGYRYYLTSIKYGFLDLLIVVCQNQLKASIL